MELLQWSTVARGLRRIFRKSMIFQQSFCAWCPHSNIKILIFSEPPKHAWNLLQLHLVPIPHSFWPREAPKSRFFARAHEKSHTSKMLKMTIFCWFSKCCRIWTENRVRVVYPPKWRQRHKLDVGKMFGWNADIRHTRNFWRRHS